MSFLQLKVSNETDYKNILKRACIQTNIVWFTNSTTYSSFIFIYDTSNYWKYRVFKENPVQNETCFRKLWCLLRLKIPHNPSIWNLQTVKNETGWNISSRFRLNWNFVTHQFHFNRYLQVCKRGKMAELCHQLKNEPYPILNVLHHLRNATSVARIPYKMKLTSPQAFQ